MSVFELLQVGGHEEVVLASDPAVGYRGVIAIHSTALGPAVGGTRWWTYASDEDAIVDALRLSRGMSYKNALAGLPLGGGKGVILGSPGPVDRPDILRAHGRFIDRFRGLFVTGEDVGTTPADMEYIAETTPFVAGRAGQSGDPSPHTGRGVFRAMQAAARNRWGTDSLAGKTVTLQGCGNVGYHLAGHLARDGARLVVSDLDDAKAGRVVAEFGARAVPHHRIVAEPADVFAPCALGAIINDATIPDLKAELVVGGANNQLLEPRHGDELARRGILYIPDYVANAGGVTFGGSVEVLKLTHAAAAERVEAIYDITQDVLEQARSLGIPPYQAADRMAEALIGGKTVRRGLSG
ncbi:MAG: Glu/Leu/Phe/Val dehydrogenase dimerization domain-containing protein [Gemmatimonadota bacterium]